MRSYLAVFAAGWTLSAPLAAASAAPAPAATASPADTRFDRAVAQEVVTKLADSLERYFVFPKEGKAYAEMLRAKLEAGAYASFPNPSAFAKAVNADLQRTHPDGHLQLFPPGGSPYANHPQPQFIEQAGWIAPHVAYIRFFAFPGDAETMKSVQRFLDTHANAKSLIIDARDHHGGGIAEMDLIFSKIFPTKTPLVALDTRSAADERQKMPFVRLASVRPAKGPPGYVRRIHWATPSGNPSPLRQAKVYLLTSRKTVSAAEHLAFALKRTHRATLIGEVTRGADHFGTDLDLPGGYEAFLPVGRSVDPKTGEDWEPAGVRPDIAVPADKALVVALEKAGLSPAEAERVNSRQPRRDDWGRPISSS